MWGVSATQNGVGEILRELTRTEEIIYHALLAMEAQENKLGRNLTDVEFLTIVERAAGEIKGKIHVYREEELVKKLEEQ